VDIRQFFFRNRSFTPIPIALMIIYFAGANNSFRFIGFVLLLIGETIRIWAVSHAGGATRTRNVGAPSLCSSGPYAHSRNPLYVGNMLMYIGIVLIAGVPNGFFMVMVTTIFFLIQYTLIISLEEETLDTLFGNEYMDYKKNVPPIIPRLSPWKGAKKKRQTPILETLKTEKRTLQNVFLMLLLLFIKNSPTV
jgi:protein-S-isoprenylcysteine O-methyltransferase Ste14